MTHPLVKQLRFTRHEFKRGLVGVDSTEALRRFEPMNCISWMIGHLAWQEQRNWLTRMQSKTLFPQLNELVAYGKPACTPALDEMWTAWDTVTQASDLYLDSLTTEDLLNPLMIDGKPSNYRLGTVMQRVIYHYWYHTGEGLAVRQMLGHTNLPEYVGDLEEFAPFEPY